MRGPIIELQEGRCFYCAEGLASRAGQTPDVDHFIPWSRYPDDGLENLVVAHARCNAQKRDFLAAAAHVGHWRARMRSGSPVAAELDRVAEAIGWSRHPERTLGVARALYLRLPEDARLWLRGEEFVIADRPALEAALGRELMSCAHPRTTGSGARPSPTDDQWIAEKPWFSSVGTHDGDRFMSTRTFTPARGGPRSLQHATRA